MHYNKLVRDNIPDIIRAKGESPTFHVATAQEYWDKLKEKLLEECKEFLANENESEIADIFEVLDAIVAYKRFVRADIEELKSTKARQRGKFEKRIILDEA